MKILAIGAHPDDIELGCGGLLIKAARQGHDVHMYSLTRGAASGDPNQRTTHVELSGEGLRTGVQFPPAPPFINLSWCRLVSEDPEKPRSINDLGFFLGNSHPRPSYPIPPHP